MKRKNHLKMARLKGISMFPTLRTGQIALYKRCSAKQLKVGDVIVFKANNKLVCHRLIFKLQTKNTLILLEKGDNPLYMISRLHPNCVIGKFLQSPKISWWLVLITIPGLCFGYAFFTIKKVFGSKSLGIIHRLSKITSIK